MRKKESGIGREGDGGRRFRDAGLGTGFGSWQRGISGTWIGEIAGGVLTEVRSGKNGNFGLEIGNRYGTGEGGWSGR